MQNIPDCPRGKGFIPVSYQVSTQDIWINDICSVTDKPRIRMWPWSSIMHSYHMVNITRTKTISLFNAKIREIRFSLDNVDTEKCTTLIFFKWHFSNWHFQVDSEILYSSKIGIDIHLDLEKYIHVFGAFSTRFRYSKWTIYRAFTAYTIEFESHFIIYALAIHWHHLSYCSGRFSSISRQQINEKRVQ